MILRTLLVILRMFESISKDVAAMRADLAAIQEQLGVGAEDQGGGATQAELDALGQRLLETTKQVEAIDPPQQTQT